METDDETTVQQSRKSAKKNDAKREIDNEGVAATQLDKVTNDATKISWRS